MEKTVIGKCGHDVMATVSDEGEYLNVPDCCKDCEEPPENQIEICPDCGFSVIGCICDQRGDSGDEQDFDRNYDPNEERS